jgi:hypothetical protein
MLLEKLQGIMQTLIMLLYVLETAYKTGQEKMLLYMKQLQVRLGL